MNQTTPNIQWRKSSHSTDLGGQCVEIGALPGRIAVRDSKNPDAASLAFTRAAFRTLVQRLRVER